MLLPLCFVFLKSYWFDERDIMMTMAYIISSLLTSRLKKHHFRMCMYFTLRAWKKLPKIQNMNNLPVEKGIQWIILDLEQGLS